MIRVVRVLAAAAALVVAVPAARVHAQPAGAQAEVLFKQARDLMAAGKLAEACAAFDESEKLDPAVTTLLNLAGCREKNGQLATAWGLFLDAERQTRAGTDDATRQLHDVAADRAKKLELRVSKLTINVPQGSQVDGLTITRGKDAVDPAEWNRALPVDGGTYTVSASAPGSATWSTEVAVNPERDTKTVDVPDLRNLPRDLGPNAKVTPPAGGNANSGGTRVGGATGGSSLLPAIAVGAGAVVLLGGALGFDLWGNSTYDDAKQATAQSQQTSLYNSANDKRYVAIGLGAAGIVAAGAAVYLIIRADHGGGEAQRTARRGVHVVPTGTGFAVVGWY